MSEKSKTKRPKYSLFKKVTQTFKISFDDNEATKLAKRKEIKEALREYNERYYQRVEHLIEIGEKLKNHQDVGSDAAQLWHKAKSVDEFRNKILELIPKRKEKRIKEYLDIVVNNAVDAGISYIKLEFRGEPEQFYSAGRGVAQGGSKGGSAKRETSQQNLDTVKRCLAENPDIASLSNKSDIARKIAKRTGIPVGSVRNMLYKNGLIKNL